MSNREHPHPLLLYPVLKRILNKLHFQDFLACREVCTTWKSEVDIQLAKKSKIKIRSSKNLKKFIKEICLDETDFHATHFELGCLNLENSHQLFTSFGPQLQKLELHLCDWRSANLRTILFKKLPNLQTLEISTDNTTETMLSEPLWPMSFIPYGSFSPLVNLKEFKIIGDFSNRTDLFYDLLKSSPNLEKISLSKYHCTHDDLFGTWLTEIILSSNFFHLKCLELQCTLIQLQLNSIVNKQYPLKRLCIDFDMNAVNNSSIHKVISHFPSLESVELGIHNASKYFVNSILDKYKSSSLWISIHPFSASRIIYPNHEYMVVQ